MIRDIKSAGFTLVEMMVVVVLIGILAGITAVGYGGYRREVSDSAVRNDLTHATSSLEAYKNFNSNYPPNLAGANYAASRDSALVLYTNAPTVGVYQNLTPAQNTQLFLNVCNANFLQIGSTCTLTGTGLVLITNGVSILGIPLGLNLILPTLLSQAQFSSLIGTLGSTYNNLGSTINSQFTGQGGLFPLQIGNSPSALPTPTQVPNGPASRFCLQANSGTYPDVVYHTTDSNPYVTKGPCPSDPGLTYYSQDTSNN